MTDKLSPAQEVMNVYKQRTLATKRSTAVIGVLQTIADQLKTLNHSTRFGESEELEQLCHSLGVNQCRVHILNIIIELCDSND